MKKKISLIITAVALATLMVVGGTLAWFTDSEETQNEITMGNIDVRLIEGEQWANPVEDVVPGAEINKEPYVTNEGKNPAVIRSKVEITTPEGNGINSETIEAELFALLKAGSEWIKDGDYFYYLNVLAPGAHTGIIFEEFTIPTKWGNKYEDIDIKKDFELVKKVKNTIKHK